MLKRGFVATASAVALLAAGCGGTSALGPTTVTARFFDGITHGDTRQACAQLIKSNRGSMPKCEVGYVVLLAQFAFYYGRIPAYQVVAHSAKVWTQEYCRRWRSVPYLQGPSGRVCAVDVVTVERATVLVTVRGRRSLLLKVHLSRTPHGWRITEVESVS